MLAPLKIDFNPDAFSLPLSEADAEMFRTCGITGFHNSVGVGGATAYDEALQFIAAWSGFAGRNATCSRWSAASKTSITPRPSARSP